jgi:Flp pilus assembly pilin Flp
MVQCILSGFRRFGARSLRRWCGEERAATVTETAFVMAVLIVLVLGAITALGQKNRDIWQFVGDTLGTALGQPPGP